MEHSRRRARDILDLLSELRTARGVGTQFSNGAAAAFVSLLSVFRRSRCLPMLRSIIERGGLRNIGGGGPGVMSRATHKAVDDLLGQLSTAGGSPVGLVAQLHEGGTVWLYRWVVSTPGPGMRSARTA